MKDVAYYVEQAARALQLADRSEVSSLSERLTEVAVSYLDAAERLRAIDEIRNAEKR